VASKRRGPLKRRKRLPPADGLTGVLQGAAGSPIRNGATAFK
jgi:hypothetical protein